MYADTIDYGPYVGRLRAFGPPEVVPLADFAGNGSESEKVSGFWELVEAVTFKLVTDNTAVDRFPLVEFFAGESVPFASVVAPFDIGASHTARFSFVTGVFPGTSGAGSAFVGALPRLLLLPGYSVGVSVIGGVAGDAVSEVRVCRQRYEVIRDGEG